MPYSDFCPLLPAVEILEVPFHVIIFPIFAVEAPTHKAKPSGDTNIVFPALLGIIVLLVG